MKNTFKLLGIIAIVAVIGFSFAACGGDDDGGSSGGDGGGSGGISGGTITYPDGIADANKPIDFSFLAHDERPISTMINEPASVTISGNKLNINLGTPKDSYLRVWNNQGPSSYDNYNVTATPADAKLFFNELFAIFSTVDQKYWLVCQKGNGIYNRNDGACLVYAEKDLTIKGSYQYSKGSDVYNGVYNVSLKKGWNYVIVSNNRTERIVNYTASTKLPDGFYWVVFNREQITNQ